MQIFKWSYKLKLPSFFELWSFFLKLLISCKFAVVFFLCLAFGKYVTTFGLHFYDFLFVCVVVTQAIFLITKVETLDEVKIIMIYHVVWFVMEAFKTHPAIGSRTYPDPGVVTLFGVPLYSGFMYSAVGSFIFQAWERLDLRFTHFPKFVHIVPIAVLIYVNFFAHHFILDFRYVLLVIIVAVSWKARAWFRMNNHYRKIHVLLGLAFIGVGLWMAENIATFFGAWIYPSQKAWWTPVSVHKIFSWFLLFIISIVIVSAYKMRFGRDVKKFEYKKE